MGNDPRQSPPTVLDIMDGGEGMPLARDCTCRHIRFSGAAAVLGSSSLAAAATG